VSLAVAFLQFFRVKVRFEHYSLWHNAPLYTRTWYNPKEGAEIALSGKEIVRERFLLTRLIADELELYASLLGGADGGALRRLTDLSTDI
jgi:hypothetical protein